MSVKILESRSTTRSLVSGLGRIPKPVRGLARTAAAFAGVRGALDHIEEQLISAARGICGLGRVVGLVFQAKPALGVDLNLAFRCVAPKMKVQTHCETPPGSPQPTHLVHGPVSEHGLAVNIALSDRAKISTVVGQTAMI